MTQDTLPGCDQEKLPPSETLASVLVHAGITIHTTSSLQKLASARAAQAHPDNRVITHVAWNIGTFPDAPPVLIITYRLQIDEPELPDRVLCRRL